MGYCFTLTIKPISLETPAMYHANKIIINADGFGYNATTNEAIVKSFQRGLITSTSLMTNMQGYEDAVRQAVERATSTIRNVQSVWVKEFEAVVENDKVTQFRVNVKLSFLLDEGAGAG